MLILILHLVIRPLPALLALLEMIWYDIFPTLCRKLCCYCRVCSCHVRRHILHESACVMQLPTGISLLLEYGH